MTDIRNNLWGALARAQAHIGALGKDGAGARGDYTTCESAIDATRRALAEEGLALFVESSRLEELAPSDEIDPTTGAVRSTGELVINRDVRLVHVESGASTVLHQVWPVVVGRGRPLDHATASADSFGLTYLLRGLMMFSRGEGFEGEGVVVDREPRERLADRQAAPAPRAAPTPEPAPAPEPTPEPEPKPEPMRYDKPLEPQREARRVDSVADPSAADLEQMGWCADAPTVYDLEALPAGDEVDRALARDLHKVAVALTSKAKAVEAWRSHGVELGKDKPAPTGTQARLFAASIAIASNEYH